MDEVDELTALVPGAQRVIRRLEDSAALPGDLVCDGDRQRVSADAGGLDEALWRFAAAEHVAGVRDVVRTRDGQAALLPWCADSLDMILARRAAAERPLGTGEIVTLVGSLLRGVIEVAGYDVRGRWWLDDEARPLFVPGEGMSCAGASVEIIERLRDDCGDRALERQLRRVADAAADHRVVLRSLDDWERELTELAAPKPIEVSVYAPEPVRDLPVHRAHLPLDAERIHGGPTLRERLSAARGQLSERLGAVRMRVTPAETRKDRAGDRSQGAVRTPRRRMLLVGAAVAGVVLAGGLLWPTGGEDSSAMDQVVVPTDAAAPPAATPATSVPPAKDETTPTAAETAPPTDEGTPESPAVDGSVEAAVAGLLETIDACRADENAECADAVVSGAGDDIIERLGPDSATRTRSLIEDYGDIAVVRLGPTRERGEQMIVVVRQNDEWLARDVYDVADQPSEKG
ncbi:hypothetical protein QF046_000376 [Microbacterium sp. W4I4]|uniref:hypothetical protein n=1 Tax=Microbacterium sp. W4I4 TaxID=3042295 RepID=UPI00278A039D|nr:hypothetical protein [Microbacterium sp. W4I4]MDQ0612735.1 hypothetical protein [Microbacterium sp. W4I4]